MLGMILLAAAAATCEAAGNTPSAETLADSVCALLEAEAVTATESKKSILIEATLGEDMTREFRAYPQEDIDKALLGICIVFGSRILKTKSVFHWEITGSDGEILVDWKCPDLAPA